MSFDRMLEKGGDGGQQADNHPGRPGQQTDWNPGRPGQQPENCPGRPGQKILPCWRTGRATSRNQKQNRNKPCSSKLSPSPSGTSGTCRTSRTTLDPQDNVPGQVCHYSSRRLQTTTRKGQALQQNFHKWPRNEALSGQRGEVQGGEPDRVSDPGSRCDRLLRLRP